MSATEKHIEVTLSAPYCTLNQLTSQTKRIWLIFHGYGMLSKYFIKKFEQLDANENFIIAPQGLSKSYLEGYSGRVGATWMTKEDRLTEIDNQIRYINAIVEKEINVPHDAEVILLGFSQGGATASRYGVYGKLPLSKLVLWAGMFPEDIPAEDVSNWKGNVRILYFSGKQDPFVQPGLHERFFDIVEKATGITPEYHEFEGKHEVVPELLPLIF